MQGGGGRVGERRERLANKIFIMRLTCRMRDVLFFLWLHTAYLAVFSLRPRPPLRFDVPTLSRCFVVHVCVCVFCFYMSIHRTSNSAGPN